MVVALDLHGLVIDHRRAKYEYFRDVEGIDYTHPLTDRAGILRHMRQHGYDREYYFAALARFFQSEYPGQPALVPGIQSFFKAAPGCWRFLIISGPYRIHEHVTVMVERVAAGREVEIVTRSEETRAQELVLRGIRLYFDDKPDHLPAVSANGIPTVQICEPDYAETSASADLAFESWAQAVHNLDSIARLLRE